jgi:hypothetical protein
MKTKYITDWETWKKLCLQNNVDPYENVDFGIDEGGGNSMNWEYVGDVPDKEEKKSQQYVDDAQRRRW